MEVNATILDRIGMVNAHIVSYTDNNAIGGPQKKVKYVVHGVYKGIAALLSFTEFELNRFGTVLTKDSEQQKVYSDEITFVGGKYHYDFIVMGTCYHVAIVPSAWDRRICNRPLLEDLLLDAMVQSTTEFSEYDAKVYVDASDLPGNVMRVLGDNREEFHYYSAEESLCDIIVDNPVLVRKVPLGIQINVHANMFRLSPRLYEKVENNILFEGIMNLFTGLHCLFSGEQYCTAE